MMLTEIEINPVDTPTRWDEATVTTLKTLWAEGWSGADIAHELGNGHTRNSVIGKVHRLGIAKRSRLRSKARNYSAPRRIVVKPPRLLVHVKARPRPVIPVAPYVPLPQIETTHPGIGLLALTDHTCRWPLYANDAAAADRLFCGAEPVEHSSYCGVHRARGLREVSA